MTTDPAPKKDFFISYNKADKAWAEWIAWQLKEAGYTVIIQAWDFRPGSNFILEMQKAAAGSDESSPSSRTITSMPSIPNRNGPPPSPKTPPVPRGNCCQSGSGECRS